MKHILPGILLLSCINNTAFSQLRFKDDGTAQFKPALSFVLPDSSQRFTIDLTDLQTWRNKSIAKFKKDLKNSNSITIDILDDHSLPLSLTKWLLKNDTMELRSALQNIIATIDSGNVLTGVSNTCPFYLFAQSIAAVTTAQLYHISTAVATRQLTYTLTQEEIISKFLTEYYIATLSQPVNKQVGRTTLTDYYNFYNELKPQYDTIQVLLQRIAREAKPEIIEQLYIAHLAFNDYVQKSQFIKLLHCPFYKQWLWSTGAAIKLNPLDFTAAGVLDTVPSLDLLSKNFSKDEFLNRNKRLTEENAKSMQKLLYPAQVTNKIEFPIGDTGKNQYFLLNTKEKNLEMPDIRNLDEKEKIYLQLLNIDKGYKARFKVTGTRQLSGFSPTEEIIDTVSRGLLTLFQLLNPQTAAIAGILDGLNRQSFTANKLLNNEANFDVFIAQDFVGFDEISDHGKRLKFQFLRPITLSRRDTGTFWLETKTLLEALIPGIVQGDNSELTFYELDAVKNIQFNPDIYNLLRKKYKQEVLDSINTNDDKKIKSIRQKIISDYLGKMYARQIAPILIDSLRNDSFYIAQLINLLSCSLPVKKIETSTDTVPKFRSELIVIDDKLNKVEQSILIDRIKTTSTSKDSSDIVTFSYKKEKRSLVEVSFGLSYTFQNVWVQKVINNKVTSKNEQYRGVAAIHFYPFRGKNRTRPGLYKTGEPFFGSVNRINFMLGAGVPKPLENYYLGVGYDFGPGLKLNAGVHLHKYRQYTMLNDAITGDEPIYKTLFPFVSLSLNPQLVVSNIISVFKIK
jgi:hypothetical protein